MSPGQRKPFFKKIYLQMIGLGLMLFGVFALFFREYNHPI